MQGPLDDALHHIKVVVPQQIADVLDAKLDECWTAAAAKAVAALVKDHRAELVACIHLIPRPASDTATITARVGMNRAT